MEAPRITQSSGGCSVALFGVGGVVSLLLGGLAWIGGSIFWWALLIAGLLCFIIAAVMGKTSAICGHCGNTVAETSVLCPACHAVLRQPDPLRPVNVVRYIVIGCWIFLGIMMVIATAWLIWNQKAPH